MALRYSKDQDFRIQTDGEGSRSLVELEAKVRHDVRAPSIRILNDVYGQASHTCLEEIKAMYRLFYDTITRVGDELVTRVCGVRASVATGPTRVTEGPVGVVGVPVTSHPMAAGDAHVVVVKKAASDAVEKYKAVGVPPGVVVSDEAEQDGAVGVPPVDVASDPVAEPIYARDARGYVPPS